MTDRELFEWLKREGECWHHPVDKCVVGVWKHWFECEGCGQRFSTWEKAVAHSINPDFSTPDGFFWLKDRLVEKKLWAKFCLYCWGKLYGKGVKPPAVWAGSLPEEYIDPPRFVAAVKGCRLKEKEEGGE